MGLFDKLKDVVNTAADSINKAMEESKNAKDPLGDPAVKKYYEVAYGLMKSIECKETIKKHAADFGGTLNDTEVMTLCKISRNSYYKYKRELKSQST